jgi:hypothetical protein
MRSFFLGSAFLITSLIKAQTFYEKIMDMNIANADTSGDRAVLDMSAKAMQRVSRGVTNNWDAAFHMALCFVRMTDISLSLKDTVGAKIALGMSAAQLRKVDTMSTQSVETKLLQFYHKINELRMGKKDAKKIDALETSLETYKNSNSENPRVYLLEAYFYRCFFSSNKVKRKKIPDLLKQSEKLFSLQKPNGYAPHWGKKWLGELIAEQNVKDK